MTKSELLNKESQTKDLVMVEFYADWCPHCQRMKPIVKEFEEKSEGSLNLLIRINIDEEEKLANEYGVDTIPTFILMRAGQELWRKSGELTLDKLEAALEMNK